MKTISSFALVLVIALAALAPRALLGQTNVNFPDPHLEATILAALHRTNRPLTTTDLLSLTNLTCWSGVTNLTGLESAENLQSLSLYYNRSISLAPLVGLAHLERLDLEDAGPVDQTNLTKLTHLTRLDLYNVRLIELSCLAGLTNLTYLDLGWNSISNASALAQLPSLQYLDLSGNPLSSGAGLGALTNLTGSLFLDSLSLTNTDCLGGLVNLRELTLYQNQVADIAPLSNLTNLTLLDLGCNRVQDLSSLAPLTNLQSLYLQANSLSNLTCLPLLPKLVDLEVSYNRLSTLDALAGLTNLSWLDANHNLLTNLAPLTNLSHLATVYLWVNLLQTNAGSADLNAIQTLQGRGVDVYYEMQNGPPYISVVTNWFVPASEPSYSWFYISDDFTAADHLQVTVQSSNTNVLNASLDPGPVPGFPGSSRLFVEQPMQILSDSQPSPRSISISGLGTSLKIIPVTNQTGTAVVTVTATDDTGFSSSANVTVTVSPPVPFDGQTFGDSASNLTWRTFGQALWTTQTNTIHAGGSAAQSGSAESWLEATLAGPGTLTFWWKTDSSNSYGSGGILQAACTATGLSGSAWLSNSNWQKETLSFPDGTWTLRWQKEAGYPTQSASPVWVADVTFVPGPPICWFDPPRSVSFLGNFSLALHGPPGELYDVESSSDLSQWSKAGRVYMNGFTSWFVDTNSIAAAQFYRMSKAVLLPLQLAISHLDWDPVPQLSLRGEPGQPVSIEVSTNLITWETLLQTNNVEGTLQLPDPTATNSFCRFYRAKALPWPTRLAGPGPGLPVLPGRPGSRPGEYPMPGPGGFPPPPIALTGVIAITGQ